jgi:HAE1 family hydrophobic/amphiphilic exporter-1
MEQVQTALGTAFGETQVSTIYGDAAQYQVILQVERSAQDDPDVLSKLYLSAAAASSSRSTPSPRSSARRRCCR